MRPGGETDLRRGPLPGGGGGASVLGEDPGEHRGGSRGDLQSGAHQGVQE